VAMPSEPIAAGAPAPTIRFKDVTSTYKLRRVEIPPGAVVPRYRVETGYVVFTVSPGTVRKTTFREGLVESVEELTLDPAKPYYVPGFPPGVEVSVENIGTTLIICGKLQVGMPDYNW
jgi:hypothetical protein